jgi:hypothetical protein
LSTQLFLCQLFKDPRKTKTGIIYNNVDAVKLIESNLESRIDIGLFCNVKFDGKKILSS